MRRWVYPFALIAVGVVSRLPQLLSRNLLLDGDECILGLMARHLAQGREFPVFFYGQNYGLALFEAPAGALSFLILGTGALPLKLAILVLWVVGVLVYFVAFARPLGRARSFWITLVLVLMPAWAVSSMKGWSGYVTAFSATAFLFNVTTAEQRLRSSRWVLAGLLTAIIWCAQPSWLPGLLPILLFFLLTSRSASSWLSFAAGTAGGVLSIALMKTVLMTGAVESWTRPPIGNPDLLESWPALLEQLYVNLTGSFYLRAAIEPGQVTSTAAYLWLGILAAVALLQVYRLTTARYLAWSHLLFLSVLTTLVANWLFLGSRDARYLLSLDAPLVFVAGVEFCDFVDRHRLSTRRCAASVVVVLALEAVSMLEFAQFNYMWWKDSRHSPSEAATLEKVVLYLRANGVRHAFSMNALLQWQITFYSQETVIARWTANVDRYPPYIADVDRALDNGEPVAVVGYVGYTGGLERLVSHPQAIVEFDRKYFIYLSPDKDLLRRARFRFAR